MLFALNKVNLEVVLVYKTSNSPSDDKAGLKFADVISKSSQYVYMCLRIINL
jgi:hypothetical protein